MHQFKLGSPNGYKFAISLPNLAEVIALDHWLSGDVYYLRLTTDKDKWQETTQLMSTSPLWPWRVCFNEWQAKTLWVPLILQILNHKWSRKKTLQIIEKAYPEKPKRTSR